MVFGAQGPWRRVRRRPPDGYCIGRSFGEAEREHCRYAGARPGASWWKLRRDQLLPRNDPLLRRSRHRDRLQGRARRFRRHPCGGTRRQQNAPGQEQLETGHAQGSGVGVLLKVGTGVGVRQRHHQGVGVGRGVLVGVWVGVWKGVSVAMASAG